ncbi:actin-3 [Esox lucius]|uniref:actin-3 n=1 Tax=Esox lucius TaxID=8010 RepID=UPI001476984E|nr:actin-3 [Esox lucius]
MSFSPSAVVIDNGTDQIRVGTSGNAEPSHIFKNVTGRSESKSNKGNLYFGGEVWGKRDNLSVIHPMERGKVVSWADMEATWSYVFNTHVKNPSGESPVLLTEFPLTTRLDRERTCRTMFEALDVPALFMAPQSVLALMSSGRISGCVADCGYDVTHTVPVYEGYCLQHAVHQLGLGGQDVTDRLGLLLKARGSQFSSATQERDIVTNIKEQMCYISTDLSLETATTITDSAQADYQLPDGQMLRISSERFGAPEILFSPQMVFMVTPGIPSLLVSSVLESDADLRPLLLDNVVLAGGSSLFPGMGFRIRQEASALVPPGACVGPVPVMETAWLGGSLLASLSIFGDMCISSSEYQEMGSNVVHHKFF